MLKLEHKRSPQRIVLRAAEGKEPEAFVLMAPITPAMRRRANAAMRRALGEGGSFDHLDQTALFDVSEAASRELIRLGALEWGGIGDAAGKALELTPDRDTRMRTSADPERPTGTVDLLLDDEQVFERIETEYVAPDARRRAEKNALSASPAGTGGAGTRGKGTASSRAAAKRRKTGTRTTAAKSARTSSTRSKRKQPKASGRS